MKSVRNSHRIVVAGLPPSLLHYVSMREIERAIVSTFGDNSRRTEEAGEVFANSDAEYRSSALGENGRKRRHGAFDCRSDCGNAGAKVGDSVGRAIDDDDFGFPPRRGTTNAADCEARRIWPATRPSSEGPETETEDRAPCLCWRGSLGDSSRDEERGWPKTEAENITS